MGGPFHREDLADNAVTRLLSGFDEESWEAFVRAFADEAQELEDAQWDTIVFGYLNNAFGATLDQYGSLVAEERAGLTDNEYRQIILAKLLRNRCDNDIRLGPIEAMKEVLRLATSASHIRYVEIHPAAIRLTYVVGSPLSTTQRDRAVRLVRSCAPAGVRISWVAEALTGYFGFEGDPLAEGFDVGRWASIVG